MTYNTLIVLAGVGLLGAAAGLVGSFAVLRRQALLGDALAHAALPGLCIGFLLLGQRNLAAMLLGALATGLLGIATISFLCRWTRIRRDAAIGIVLSVFFGAGIVLGRVIQNMTSTIGSKAGLDSYILGKTAGIVAADVALMATAAGFCVLVIAALFKEFFLISFDVAFAQVQGWPAQRLDLVLTGLVAIIVVIGLPTVGVVMVAALLIIPGVTARFWTSRLSHMIVASAAIGLAMGLIGTAVSALYDKMPAGPIITLVGTGFFIISSLVAPHRGLWAMAHAVRRDRWRADWHEALRLLYEAGEANRTLKAEQLFKSKSWSRKRANRLMAALEESGYIRSDADGHIFLTDAAQGTAVNVVRHHRLWRLLVTEYPDLVPLARPLTGEGLEATIAPGIIDELTSKLRSSGRWPSSHSMPAAAVLDGKQ